MSLSHFAPAATLMWEYLKSCGHDPAPLYRKAGINSDLLSKPDARIKVASVDRLWHLVNERLDDPCFGIKMTEHWHPSRMGSLGYAWLVSTTLRTALDRLVRYIHVVTEAVELKTTNTPRGLTITLRIDDSVNKLPQQEDAPMAIIMHMCRYNFGEGLTAVNVSLAHDEPACSKVITDYFKSPVTYNTELSSITFSVRDVDKVLATANKKLALMHDDLLMRYLIEIKKGDFIEQIKSIIIDHLPDGNVTDQLVANELNLSERSLQRKLKEKGTTFRLILDDVREMMAIQYIKDPVNRMSDIAFLIGFSEQSAFSRAFKKWTGISPLKYRESLTQQ
jgi:AraC-like DNA-binding protein